MSRRDEARVQSAAFAERGVRQAIAYETWFRRAQAGETMPLSEAVARVNDGATSAVFVAADGSPFGIGEDEHVQMLINGPPNVGKTSLVHSLLCEKILAAALRSVRIAQSRGIGLDVVPLDLEILALDPKEDAQLLKARIAALYRRASDDIRRVLRGAFARQEAIGEETSIRPITRRWPGVSVEIQADVQASTIAQTDPSDWSEGMRHMLYQTLRLIIYRGDPADELHITRLLRDETYRRSLLIAGVPPELAYYFAHLKDHVAPQTVVALIRRLQKLFSFRHVRAMLGLVPADAAVAGGKPRRVTIVDVGVRTALPPSVRIAQANTVITELGLTAGNRDRSVWLVAFIEEALWLLSKDSALLARFIDQIRVMRSARVACWIALQRLESLPASTVEELLENAGAVVSFRSGGALVDALFRHLHIAPSDLRRDADRRVAFQREMESLPPQEVVVWRKSAPAVRARVRTAPGLDGVPEAELVQQFNEELAPGTTMSLDEAERRIAAWRERNLPSEPKALGPSGSFPNAPSADEIFGTEDEP